jgi:acyl carrier protein
MENEILAEGADTSLRERVFGSILALLPGVMGRELPGLSGETKLMEELGMRSSNLLELLVGLEDDLEIEIDVEEIDESGMRSVGDLADFVAGHTITGG